MCCCVRVYTYFRVTNKPYEAGCIGQCKYLYIFVLTCMCHYDKDVLLLLLLLPLNVKTYKQVKDI